MNNKLKLVLCCGLISMGILSYTTIKKEDKKKREYIAQKELDKEKRYDDILKMRSKMYNEIARQKDKNKELRIKKEQEIKKQKEMKEKQAKIHRERQSRGMKQYVNSQTFTLTFYTSLDCENGGYGGITCSGAKLKSGMVANNVLPQGTRIDLQGYGVVKVSDRGGSDFEDKYRLDVFIPRNYGESDYHYKKRVNNMGRVKVKGYIINK